MIHEFSHSKFFVKFLASCTLILLSITSLNAQNCWHHLYPSDEYINTSKIFPHSKGFYVYQRASHQFYYDLQPFLYSFDSFGQLLFKKHLSNTYYNFSEYSLKSVYVNADGRFVIASAEPNGNVYIKANGDTVEYNNLVIRQYNREGITTNDEIEYNYFDEESYIGRELFVKEMDDGEIIGAFTICDSALAPDTCLMTHSRLVRLSPDGNLISLKDFEGYVFTDIIRLDDGSYLISAFDTENSYSIVSGELNMIKLNYNGEKLWTKNYDVNTHLQTYLQKSTDNHVFVFRPNLLLKIDLDGDVAFELAEHFRSVVALENGSFAGLRYNTFTYPKSRIFIQQYDSSGVLLNELLLPDTTNTGDLGSQQSIFIGHDFRKNNDGRFYISSYRRENDTGPGGLFIISMDEIQTCENQIREETNLNANHCAFLDAGNIKAGLCTDGMLFSPHNGGGYYAPKDSITATIFASNFWLGGKDVSTGELHVSHKVYDMKGFYLPGQRGENNKLSPAESNLWDRVWRVSHIEVLNHINDFLENGKVDNPQPSIFEWPGKGNVHAKGKYAKPLNIETDAAPFIDLNGNGIYEPHLGEYPAIKGCQMIWFVINDYLFDQHYSKPGFWSLESPVGADIQVLAYAFSDTDKSDLYNSIITEFNVINRSDRDYEDFYFGNFVDFEIGCFSRNYLGSNIPTHTFYGYSATETDPGCATPGYGQNPPVQTATFLNHSMSSFREYTKSNDPVLSQPHAKEHFYNFLLGLWRDGTPITEGGYGFGGTIPTTYMYPGNPANPQEWSQCAENHTPSYRRGVAASGPFDLPQNAALKVKMLYTTHFQENLGGCFDFDSKIKPVIEDLRNNYPNYVECTNEGVIPEIPDSMIIYDPEEKEIEYNTVNIYPNPASDLITLELLTEKDTDILIQVYNAMGQMKYNSKKQTAHANQLFEKHLDFWNASGVYFIEIKMGDEKVIKRVVVQ